MTKDKMSHAQMEIFGLNRYHNSVALKEQAKEKKARGLDNLVLAYFKENKYTSFTPHQVWLIFGQQWPLTSVRRAITDLTKAGHLVVTGEHRPGLYGDKNNCWIYSKTKRSTT